MRRLFKLFSICFFNSFFYEDRDEFEWLSFIIFSLLFCSFDYYKANLNFNYWHNIIFGVFWQEFGFEIYFKWMKEVFLEILGFNGCHLLLTSKQFDSQTLKVYINFHIYHWLFWLFRWICYPVDYDYLISASDFKD